MGVGHCGFWLFFFQAEDGIRDLVRSRGLGDVYKRQNQHPAHFISGRVADDVDVGRRQGQHREAPVSCDRCPVFVDRRALVGCCLLYTSDAADERSSVDLGGRRIIKKKTQYRDRRRQLTTNTHHTDTISGMIK